MHPRVAVILVVAQLLWTSQLFADSPDVGGFSTPELEFTNDIMPVLSKAGCNLGICHGNLNGKGGLKLSLRGQDPEFDFRALVHASRGRRIDIAAPQRSLFLQKAIGQLPHGGGVRFSAQSLSHQLLTSWIRSGANGPSSDSAQLVRLEVTPPSAIISDPQRDLAIQVHATFSDGHRRT